MSPHVCFPPGWDDVETGLLTAAGMWGMHQEQERARRPGLQKHAKWGISTAANMAAFLMCLHGGYCWHATLERGKLRHRALCWLSQVSGGNDQHALVRPSLHQLPELGG